MIFHPHNTITQFSEETEISVDRILGGVAIYVRLYQNVIDVYRSDLYALIDITLYATTGNTMIVCGLYYPPTHKYLERNLMVDLLNRTDDLLDKEPDAVTVLLYVEGT